MEGSVITTIVAAQPLRGNSEALTILSRSLAPAELGVFEETIQAALGAARDEEFLLFVASRSGELVGAALAQRLPGRAATLWPPQLVEGENDSTALALLSGLQQRLAQADVELLQALLTNHPGADAKRLAAAGFLHAGNLLYMTCEARSFPEIPPPNLGWRLVPWRAGEEESLAHLIDRTYVGTRDCPILNGMRKTRDVIEGYKVAGTVRHGDWLVISQGEQDPYEVGCLILAEHPADRTMELIYLGVTPAARRQGLGAMLTRHAQWRAREANCERLVLAVDAANQPAIAMYAAAGFWVWDERQAWVKRINDEIRMANGE